MKSMQSNNKAATQNVTNVLGSHFYCILKNMIRFSFKLSNQKSSGRVVDHKQQSCVASMAKNCLIYDMDF